VSHSLSTLAPVTRTHPGRARPLPPDERRAALIAATVPLICELGTKVTTRQIAEAAGVAEGTIFRVFADKDELVNAAVGAVLDPVPTIAEINGIDLDLPLRERMVQLAGILQRRLLSVFGLMHAMGVKGPPEDLKGHRESLRPVNEMIYTAVEAVLAPDRDRFRYPVREVARILRLITFSGSHPLITDGSMLTAREIVSVVLDGMLARDTVPDHESSNHRTARRTDLPGED
jgi:AcrR family transcriptional regulator